MAKSSRRPPQPTDPQVIAARRAEARAAERASVRAAERDPAQWGLAAGLVALSTSADVEVKVADRKRLLSAERRDPFDQLHARRGAGGGLSQAQRDAARRLMGDMQIRAGVTVDGGDAEALGVRVQSDPTQGLVSDRMLAAGARVFSASIAIGLLHGKILAALIGPILARGHVEDWRAEVERVTGQTDRTKCAGAVENACEALRLHYMAVDQGLVANNDPPGFWRRSTVGAMV